MSTTRPRLNLLISLLLPALLSLFTLAPLPTHATPPLVQMTTQKTSNGLVLVAENPAYIAQSVDVTLTLSNFTSNKGTRFTAVIPPRVRNHQVASCIITQPGLASRFGISYKSLFGDMRATPREGVTFKLPYAMDKAFRVDQGEGGEFSHKFSEFNFNAIDFNMPEGSPVHAMAEGLVFDVVEHFDGNCPTADCADEANYIRILHADGTYTSYVHLKKNGAKVKQGDKVRAGQIIGWSGNTGWSDAPHLHVARVIHGPAFGKLRSLPMHFETEEGRQRLRELTTYAHPSR